MADTKRIVIASEDVREIVEHHTRGQVYIITATDGTPIELAPWNPDNTED